MDNEGQAFKEATINWFKEAIPDWKEWIKRPECSNQVWTPEFEQRLMGLLEMAHHCELEWLLGAMAHLSGDNVQTMHVVMRRVDDAQEMQDILQGMMSGLAE